MADYLTYPIWEIEPVDRLVAGPSGAFKIIGRIDQKQIKHSFEPPYQELSFTLRQSTKAARRTLREFFDARQGQLGSFWVASHRRDFTLYAAASAGATQIRLYSSLEALGLDGLDAGAITRHLWIKDLNQAVKIASVVQATEPVTLNITPALSGDLAAGATIQNLFFVRFGSDDLEIRGADQSDSVTYSDITLIEMQANTP